jgi:xylulokinase
MQKLILAHDLGTTGNKATLFSEEGKLIASSFAAYSTHYAPGGVAEQDAPDWWEAVCLSTRQLLEKHPTQSVDAIAFSGQMMGCLCVDREGRPLRRNILYCDQRSIAEEKAFVEKGGADEIYRITGHRASASYGATKLMWIRDHEPEIYRQTHKMLNAKDYLNFRLTGRLVTEPTDASSTNLFDLCAGQWSGPLLVAAGLDPEKLPELVKSTAVVGELTRQAAEALGLRPGIPVVAGAGDGICAGVGAGSVAEGRTYNYLGSSSWVATSSKEPVYDPEKRTFTWAHAVPGLFHPTGTMQTAAGSYAWLRREICHSEAERAAKSGGSPYAEMDKTAAGSPPGAHGLIYLPYLLGERSPRWNPLARGGFIGLTMSHTRSDLVRSVLEGVAMNLAIIVDIFRERGANLDEIVLIGGGARGGVWRQIMADVCQANILQPNYLEEATSIGAANIAGVGAGIFKDFSVVDRFFSIVDRTVPNPATRAAYQTNQVIFDKLYQALAPLFPLFP